MVVKPLCTFYQFPNMKRPFSVTILLWLVLCLTAWSGLRLATAFQWRQTLMEFASSPRLLYIAVSAGIWLIIGISLLWAMWQVKAWVRFALFWAGAAFGVWYWCDRLLLQTSRANWPFALGATVLILSLVIICVVHPRTKTFFTQRERHD